MTHRNIYCFQVTSTGVVDTKTELSGDLTLIYRAKWCLTCFLCGNISVILRNPNIAAGRCPYYLTTVVNTVPHSAQHIFHGDTVYIHTCRDVVRI